jgi:translation initiation factor 2B subunit (eIF-2B alpha/beta/delta family)
MDAGLRARVDAIGRDAESSASAILPRAIEVLREASGAGPTALAAAAEALCRAQPAMAGIWNASSAALRGNDALERFAHLVVRAPAAVARHAASLLELGVPPDRPLRLVTCSSSGLVIAAVRALGQQRPVIVSCAEGRPRYEGRRLAVALATTGASVELFTDAGVGAAMAGADAFVCGADTVFPDLFINKVGTAALVALARATGTPAYVLAGREKLLPGSARQLAARTTGGPPAEVWAETSGIAVRNPYFEPVPLEWTAGLVTDAGVLGAGMLDADRLKSGESPELAWLLSRLFEIS